MKKNKRNFAIKISGSHYFACDYVFSNIYGESVFADEPAPADSAGYFDVGSSAASIGAYDDREASLMDTLPQTPYDALITLPDCTKEIEFMTEGSVTEAGGNGIFIRYGSDESPMCIHIRNDGAVTLSGDDDDVAEFVFEKGKRNFIALSEAYFSGFNGTQPEDVEIHTPLNLCVSTEEINNHMTESGGSLTVSYSIEVNGIVAEVTDFTITADCIA